MLGGLYTKMVLWHTLGDVLEGSGWTAALSETGVEPLGKAHSFLTAAHLTRTRHDHQITLLSLHNLQKDTFMLSELPKAFVSAMAWRNDMQKKSPAYMYWVLVVKYETLILIFIRANRGKNFPQYVEILEELTLLFFALDHVNYAWWMPVHIRDMKSLPDSIKDEFENCSHWVLSKTTNKFSGNPI